MIANPIRRLLAASCLAFSLPAGRSAGLVPEFKVTDKYVTSPTMLLRAGANGEIKEIWSGMDAKRMRHVPLFLETTIFAEVRGARGWEDLRELKYHHAGTKPGFIRLESDDGLVSITISCKSRYAASPIFVTYAFSRTVDVRLSAQFKYPDFTLTSHSDDAIGTSEFTTVWRGENAALTTTDGPGLVLATLPAGESITIGRTGFAKRIESTREVTLLVDATERSVEPRGAETYVEAWNRILLGFPDEAADSAPSRISIESGNEQLDTLFDDSIDAIVSHQFASGDVMGDVFFYRDSWLRDGSYTMIGLSLAGNYPAVDKYFSFWDAQRDFSVGGEREAQQPAIGITAMWLFSRVNPDGPAFLAKVWPYVKYYGDYYLGRIKKEGMLSVSEEWICFIPSPASWPNAEIYSGLRAASKIAAALGHGSESAQWDEAAGKLKKQFAEQAYDEGKGRFIPMAGPAGKSYTDPEFPAAESRNGPLRDDRVDSGMLIMGRLEAFGRGQGIVSVDDPHFASTQAEITRDLENPDHSIFRFGPNPASPHAPGGELDTWPIAGSWAAQDEWLLGRTDLAWRYLLSGIVNKRHFDLPGACYYLPENWDRAGATDKPLIVWSHGDFVTSTLLLFLGLDLEPQGADLGLAPSLAPGMDHATIGDFHFRNWYLDVELERKGELVDVTLKPSGGGGGTLAVRLPLGKILNLKAGVSEHFTVDPSQYYVAFGRSAHGAERARIISNVLLGKAPAKDPATMTAGEVEDFIVATATGYVPKNE